MRKGSGQIQVEHSGGFYNHRFLPNVEGFTEEQKKILMHHELLHVGIQFNEDGSETYSVRPHDYEDFKEIIDRFGTEWSIAHE